MVRNAHAFNKQGKKNKIFQFKADMYHPSLHSAHDEDDMLNSQISEENENFRPGSNGIT